MDKSIFILGGNDAEMVVIRTLLERAGIEFFQPEMGWGDKVFGPELLGLEVDPAIEGRGRDERGRPAQARGVSRAYFVECQPAASWPEGTPVVVIDHHGDRSGEPASVLQVMAALGGQVLTDLAQEAEWGNCYDKADALRAAALVRGALNLSNETRRWVELVAANDAGYIPAMLALGATPEEVARVRLADRSAQGITPEQELQAEEAIAASEVVGEMVVVHLAHSKCATVSDRLFGEYPSGRENLLILSGDGEVNYFGDGALCAALKEKFPEAPAPWAPEKMAQSWAGGSGLGKAGGQAFWGGYPSQDEVLAFLKKEERAS